METIELGSLTDVVQSLVPRLDRPLFWVNPELEVFTAVVDSSFEANTLSPIRVITTDRSVKQIRNRFRVASIASALLENGQIEIRAGPTISDDQFLLTDQCITIFVRTPETVIRMLAADTDFVPRAFDYYSTVWGDADEIEFRTPSFSTLRDSLRATFGDELADDFDAAMHVLDSSENEPEIDEIVFLILLMAAHEKLFYDLGKWAEDVGIASKATFSRAKTRLEDLGLIDTEKVPIDVGRPRDRLVLRPEHLNSPIPEALIATSATDEF